MHVSLPLAAAFALALFAGCTGQGAVHPAATSGLGMVANDLTGYVDPFIRGHDHSIAANHDLAFHVQQLDHHPLGGNALKSSGAHVVEIQGEWLFVGAYGLTVDVEGGVYIFSLKDPAHPKLTGHYPMVGNVGGDRSLEATDDANWVVVGTETIDCANHVNPFGPGLYLLDVRDKANPKLADYKPDTTGVHSVVVHRIAGVDYAVTLGGATTSNGQNIWRIDTSAGKLVPVGSVQISHDGAAYDDPILHIPLLYVANVKTLDVYDWSDPPHPKKLGSWAPADVKNHYVHAVAMDLVEGRRILALESEDWGSMPSPLWILDATDLGDLRLLDTYENPAGAPANAGGENGPSLAFSTHNPRLEHGIVYMAHYHAGVWMLDARTLAKASKPEIMGYFLPHDDNGGYKPGSSQSVLPVPGHTGVDQVCFQGFQLNELPQVMDVEVKDGYAYAADLHTGLYTVRYDPTVLPAPAH